MVLFTFVNNAMVTSTQRFLNYELGHGDLEAVRRVFSASVTIHLGIALLTFVLAETVGLWFWSVISNILRIGVGGDAHVSIYDIIYLRQYHSYPL